MLDKGFQRVWYQRGNWLSLTIKLPTLLNRQSDITLESYVVVATRYAKNRSACIFNRLVS